MSQINFGDNISHANKILDGEYAPYTEVKEDKTEKNTSLTVYKVNDFRHQLMKGVEIEYLAKAEEELKIDEELGLKNQAQKTIKSLLSKDIDELTNSKDYYEVDRKTIEQIFDFPKIKGMLFFQNVVNSIKETFYGLRFVLLFTSLMVASTFLGILLANISTDKGNINNPYLFIFCVISIISAFIFLSNIIFQFCNGDVEFNYHTAKVDLNVEELSITNIKIPFGAKLKTLEAKKSGIFEDFRIITPQFTVDHRIISFKRTVDPAIVGVTADNRWYMIVYWDIEHDKEKLMKDIERYKKFKVSSV